ncbi:hypothetical protein Asp14428_31700 [Actinoplanes sp. NBRC 14428]|nr:hypothetical protein Asp14428_31700 [Actinoplanes sp. NBRC 14428]
MGVVWTMGADAAETPSAPVVAENPAEDPAAAPPLLPWGERPSPIKRGKIGASGAALKAAGADAAPEDSSTTPTALYAPKGRFAGAGSLKQERIGKLRQGAPPAPAGVADAADTKWWYYYAGGRQTGETDGGWVDLTVHKPVVQPGEYHTLAELAVQSADSNQIVEVGWTVDPKTNKDNEPHLFVYYWKDRTRSCYNKCGFTQISKTVKPGDVLPVGATKRFGIQHYNNRWWVAYDSEWVGYFLDELWEGRYTKAGLVQWFGEVTGDDASPCTDMGNGRHAKDEKASVLGNLALTAGPPVNAEVFATSGFYTAKAALKDETDPTEPVLNVRYGGPGDNC